MVEINIIKEQKKIKEIRSKCKTCKRKMEKPLNLSFASTKNTIQNLYAMIMFFHTLISPTQFLINISLAAFWMMFVHNILYIKFDTHIF